MKEHIKEFLVGLAALVTLPVWLVLGGVWFFGGVLLEVWRNRK